MRPHPLYVVLDNVRSAFNVGSIFRTCDAAGVTEICLCGLTAWPPHAKLEKTSLGAHEHVPWRRFETALEAIADLRARSIPVIGLETGPKASSIVGFRWPQPVAVVFGHEVVGLLDEVRDACDELRSIPMFGFKSSLNVATAFGIVAYDVLGSWRVS